jgi:hypothetical protein
LPIPDTTSRTAKTVASTRIAVKMANSFPATAAGTHHAVQVTS